MSRSSSRRSKSEATESLVDQDVELVGDDMGQLRLGQPDAKFSVPAHFANNTIVRNVYCNWTNSAIGLARNPDEAVWKPAPGKLQIFQSTTRYAPGVNKKVDKRQGNLEQVIVIGMKLKKVSSNFPCELGLKIHGAKGNYYTGDGNRYAYVVGANEVSSSLNEVVVTTNPYVNSEYLHRYPGMTKDNLRTVGIMEVPNESYVFVDKQHPIVEMMEENQDVLQISLNKDDLIDDRWYKVSKDIVDRCVTELQTELVNNLPIQDLSEFNVKIERLDGQDWDSREEFCDNLTHSDVQSRVLNSQRRASAVIELTYAFY